MLQWLCFPRRWCCLKALPRQWPYCCLPLLARSVPGADTSIEIAVDEAQNRIYPDCRIVCAGGEAPECEVPFCRVASGVAAVRWRTDGLRVLDERKAYECKCN